MRALAFGIADHWRQREPSPGQPSGQRASARFGEGPHHGNHASSFRVCRS